MDFLQNLMARHQTEISQPQAAISKGELPSASKIVQPRQKLRFEGGSEPLMQVADVNQDSFSDPNLSIIDSEYLRPQMSADFEEFDIGPVIHREQLAEKLNARAAGNSTERLFGALNVPHNVPQAHPVSKTADQKSSGAHLALGAIRKVAEEGGRGERKTNVVQPVSQFDSQSDKPGNGLLGVDNRFSKLTQQSAQSLSQQGDQQGAQQSTYKSSNKRLHQNAQNVGSADPASSPSSLSNSGSLQAPDWLNQIQVDLQDRWQAQAFNQKSQAEPVVNVSIGRVEVRAVQADSTPARKKRTLPSGVMTLESYLKQRDRKGGA